jgi:hypothetical protein
MADWEDCGVAGYGAWGSSKNSKDAKAHKDKSDKFAKAANDLQKASGGRVTNKVAELRARAALELGAAIKHSERPGVGDTGGPTSRGPSRGNGRFF